MSLPDFTGQMSIFDVEHLMGGQFPQDNRYRLFAQIIHPLLVQARPALARAYCPENGRPAIEPVLLMGVSLLQFMERCPDRVAIEMLTYHLGWKLALHLQLDLQRFDPTTLVHFRQRLLENDQAKLAFDTVLHGLRKAGLVSNRGARRLDSTHVLGLVAKMSVLEMLRESMRLTLRELAGVAGLPRPAFWDTLHERYVDNKLDYTRVEATLGEKQLRAGQDMALLLAWVDTQDPAVQSGRQVQLLKQVLDENFQTVQDALAVKHQPAGAVKNPHEPEADWAKKSKDKSTQWVGYKSQVAETVADEPQDQPRPAGQPTTSFITAMVTQEAIGSEDAGLDQVAAEECDSGLEPASRRYVDGGYISAGQLREAAQAGQELLGPAKDSSQRNVFRTNRFDVDLPKQTAVCPAGQASIVCTVFANDRSGKAEYRFGWDGACTQCPLKAQCLGKDQTQRTLNVTEDHPWLQARRREQETEAFKQRMHHRNAIEGTISELVRGHGLRRARYRGLEKVRLGNYFIGAACNAKRWIRLVASRMAQGVQGVMTQVQSALSEPIAACAAR